MAPSRSSLVSVILVLLVALVAFDLISANPVNSNNENNRYELPMAGYEPFATSDNKDALQQAAVVVDKRVVCYYHNTAAGRPARGRLMPDQIDAELCTHLIYSQVGLSASGEVESREPKIDLDQESGSKPGGLRQFNSLKKLNDKLKTLICVADGSSNFSKVVSSAESRGRFIRSVLKFLEEYKFDGVDLAWKYPNDFAGRPSNKRNYVLLLRELSATIRPKGYLLTAPLSVSADQIKQSYDVPSMVPYLDMMHLLTFDYNGCWDNVTGLLAPLYKSSTRNQLEMGASSADLGDDLNVDSSVNYWLELGAPAAKINLGIATFGRNFKLISGDQSGLRANTICDRERGPLVGEERLRGYNELCSDFKEYRDWTVIRVMDGQVPYAFRNNDWVSYEDRESVAAKADYARRLKGLGGVLVVSLDMDDFSGHCHNKERFPLTKAIQREFNYQANGNGVEDQAQVVTSGFKKDVPRNQPITEATPTSTTTGASTPTEAARNKSTSNIVCYYNNLAYSRSPRLSLNKVEASLCTHLVYGHLGMGDTDHKIKSLLPEIDLATSDGANLLSQLQALKGRNPSLKVLVAVGGESEDSARYSQMASDPKARDHFAESVSEFLVQHQLDGLALDWEDWPGAMDKANYVSLLSRLRSALPSPQKVLMVTAPTSKATIDASFDVQAVAAQVDLINLKSFDFTSAAGSKGRTKTRPHAPLYHSKHDKGAKERQLNVNWTVSYFLSLGAPAGKLALGISLAGDSYTLTQSGDTGINAEASLGPAAPSTQSAGFWAYYEICRSLKEAASEWTVVHDPDCQCSYAHNRLKWVAYDGFDEVKLKVDYARSQGLGGVALYSLDLDDFKGLCHQEKFPLVNLVRRQLAGVLQQEGTNSDQRKPATTATPVVTSTSAVHLEPSSSTTTTTTTTTTTMVAPTAKPKAKKTTTTTTTVAETTLTDAATTETATSGEESTTETEAPGSNVPDCEAEGRFWVPGLACNEYYDCTSGKAVLRRCERGLAWKQAKLWCDYAHNPPKVTCDPVASHDSKPKPIEN